MTDPSGTDQTGGVEADARRPESAAREDSGGARSAPGRSEKDDERFFQEIYSAHFGYVWHALRRFGVPERDLEDAAHDLFVVLHRKLDDYDRSRPIKPWLCGFAFRVASDYRRRARNRHETIGVSHEPASDKPSAEQRASENERRELVHRCLSALDDDKRAVFVLVELQGLSVPEVAEIVGAPLNTCYSRLRLARARFAEVVKAQRGLQ